MEYGNRVAVALTLPLLLAVPGRAEERPSQRGSTLEAPSSYGESIQEIGDVGGVEAVEPALVAGSFSESRSRCKTFMWIDVR